MAVSLISNQNASEETAAEEMVRDGFEAAAKDYTPGRTEPHHHDYDICLYIVEGEFRVADVETGAIHIFGPGDKALVDRNTPHWEEHGALRMVVGRRQLPAEPAPGATGQ